MTCLVARYAHLVFRNGPGVSRQLLWHDGEGTVLMGLRQRSYCDPSCSPQRSPCYRDDGPGMHLRQLVTGGLSRDFFHETSGTRREGYVEDNF